MLGLVGVILGSFWGIFDTSLNCKTISIAYCSISVLFDGFPNTYMVVTTTLGG